MEFNDEAMRISSNLSQVYESWLAAKREYAEVDYYMTWKTISGIKYLYSSQSGTEKSLGRESETTLRMYAGHAEKKEALRNTLLKTAERLKGVMAQYRALRLPQVMTVTAKILSAMDVRNALGTSFIVVGSAAFPAYEMEACDRFLDGLDETEDFDLCWLAGEAEPTVRHIDISVAGTASASLVKIIKSADKTFAASKFSPHKLRNESAFEVDVLCNTNDIFNGGSAAERDRIMGGIEPCELPGQDILRHGTLVRQIVIGRGLFPAPMVVPDPRCMALHKLWLSQQPSRLPLKKAKDAKQAVLLWGACKSKMHRFPIDAVFLDGLPEKWRAIAGELEASRPGSAVHPRLK